MGAGLLASRTKKELRRLDLRAKKGLGQHFLVDEKALGCIISAAQLTSADTVIEVGPGLGILTEELAKRAGRIIAVEIDSRLASALKETFASCYNVTIINKDILETDAAALLELIGGAADISYKVVANLPYFIGSAVVRHFVEASIKPCLMVVTVQKEVAQQMAAQPGKMSLLSVGVQFYGKPAIVDYVPASSFYPRPKVDSAIVRIDLYDQPAVQVEDATKFFRVVRGGFSAPRKQLHNSLAQGLEISSRDAAALVERAGISQKRRPETLSLDEWARVYQVCTEEGC
jgi:16S rRNA (adenine1518-N6/adenine1519-N6)-dimethyltransferase